MKTPHQPAPPEWFVTHEPNEGRIFVRSGHMQQGTSITNYTTGLVGYTEFWRRNGDITFQVPCHTEDDANTPPDMPAGAHAMYEDDERPWLYWAVFEDCPAPEDQQSVWRGLTGTVMIEDGEGERLMWAHLKAAERRVFAGLFWKDNTPGVQPRAAQDSPAPDAAGGGLQYPLF